MLRVSHVMWSGIEPVTEAAPMRQVAARLAEHGIPGLPVVDAEGLAVGMVFETDLLAAETAGDAMTRPPLGIRAAAPLSHAAVLLAQRPCLPVLRCGRPIGLIGRAALAYALARPDVDLRREVETALVLGCAVPRGTLHVEVERGRVVLRGPALPARMARDVPRVVSGVFGVASVELRLGPVSGASASPPRFRPRSWQADGAGRA